MTERYYMIVHKQTQRPVDMGEKLPLYWRESVAREKVKDMEGVEILNLKFEYE